MMTARLSSSVLFLICVTGALGAHSQASNPMPVSYICVEAESGLVLMEDNADLRRPPASMLKMMQMLLVEEGVQAGKWRYDSAITVSEHAQSMGGTQVFLAKGETWPLESLMKAIAVASANDASVAVAEGLWGSVDECLKAMNKRAAELGMDATVFHSVNGLPPDDGKTFDQTTARDMATLARALLEYPNILNFTRMKEFALRPTDSARSNTNQLLQRMPGCDGIKTGYIRAAGFCLTATAKRNDMRLIAVVMGSDRKGRFDHTQKILEEGFGMVQRVTPVLAGAIIGRPVAVVKGTEPDVALAAQKDIQIVVKNTDLNRLALEITAPRSLDAPVEAGVEAGYVRVLLDNTIMGESPLLVSAAVERKRLKHRMRELVGLAR